MGYIYLVTNLVNGHQYIGQTVQSDIKSRWKQHRTVNSNTIGRYLSDAYKKYGIDNFKFQIVCICFDSDIDELEKHYISKFNTLAPKGYNLKSGGKHRYLSKETKEKIGKKTANIKRSPLTEELKQKIRERMTGSKNHNFGKKMSEEQRKKISESKKKNQPTEKQLDALKEHRNIVRKRIGKYDLHMNLLQEYDSALEASKDVNIHRTVIAKICKKTPHYITAGGFKWQYIE